MGCYWAAPVASPSLSASTPLAGFYYAAPLDLNVCSLGDVAAHGLPAAGTEAPDKAEYCHSPIPFHSFYN